MTSVGRLLGLLGLRSLIRQNTYAKITSITPNKITCRHAALFQNVHSHCLRNISTSAALFEESQIKMPALSPTMSAGTIVKWHKKEGDKIAPGDVLCEIQTDKAVMAFEFDDEGVLAKILINENSSEVSVGTLIAIICGEGDDWKNVKVPEGVGAAAVAAASSSSATASKESAPSQGHELDLSHVRVGPSARNLLHQYAIDTSKLSPSGPHGTLLKEDVLKFISNNKLSPKDSASTQAASSSASPQKQSLSPQSQPSSQASYIDIELTSMRRTIAKRLTESKSGTPHAYMSTKCFMDDLLKLRTTLKNQSIAVSVNDLLVKAVALALKQVPDMNCQWDSASERAIPLSEVDISIAVATPTGLITPIIRNANRLTLGEINQASRDLINRAKDGKLQPSEFIGGSFSISNLGMYDIDHFTGVINPPQAAILAVGSTRKEYVGEPDDYQLKSRMTISLSYDARVVDEETVALFLEKIQSNIEQPDILLNSDGTTHRRLSALL